MNFTSMEEDKEETLANGSWIKTTLISRSYINWAMSRAALREFLRLIWKHLRGRRFADVVMIHWHDYSAERYWATALARANLVVLCNGMQWKCANWVCTFEVFRWGGRGGSSMSLRAFPTDWVSGFAKMVDMSIVLALWAMPHFFTLVWLDNRMSKAIQVDSTLFN